MLVSKVESLGYDVTQVFMVELTATVMFKLQGHVHCQPAFLGESLSF